MVSGEAGRGSEGDRKRRNKLSCCLEPLGFYASKALLSKVGDGPGNAAVAVRELPLTFLGL